MSGTDTPAETMRSSDSEPIKPKSTRPPNVKVPPKTRTKTDPTPWAEVLFPEGIQPIKIPGNSTDDESDDFKQFLDHEFPVLLGKYEWLRGREDDPTTPFNSKYSARDKMLEIREQICQMLNVDSVSPDQGVDFPTTGSLRMLHALAVASHKIGVNFIETEELHSGQVYVDYVLQHFANHVETFPVELLDTYNQLGILWSNREDFQKAEQYLLKAKKLYHELMEGEKTKKEFLATMTDQERELHMSNFSASPDIDKLEELYTLNAFFLAQVYGHMGKAALSAEYCQLCLERQLDKFEVLNLADFVHNCVGLFNYYTVVENYPQAEYCLHAARHVISKAPKEPTPRPKGYYEAEGGLPQTTAELHKTWGRFYSTLLRLGWEYKSQQRKEEYSPKEVVATYKKLPNFTLVSTTLPSTFEEALKVFKMGEVELDVAKEYYQLDGWVTDHLEILQEMSTMFTVLANFETDIPRKCKMLKRKINLFEPIINELNPRVYVDNIRNLSFELAETYQAIADLKAQHDEEGHVKKINELCFKAIRYLKMLFKTFEAPGGSGIDVPEAWMPMYISGQLALARLHTKFIHYDITQQVQQQEVALETYKGIVSFLQKSSSSQNKFPLELRMCQEMCELLPLKIAAIRAGKGDLLKKAVGTST